MTKDQKIKVVEEYVGIFQKPGIYLMDFTGLNVAEMTELRRQLREANVSMRVVKNTLAKRALEQLGNKNLDGRFVGPVGVVFSAEDSVAPAKVLVDFVKAHDKATIKAGLIDGKSVSDTEIQAISKLPSKLELQAQVASALNAPIVKLARVLNALPVKFALTVKALGDKRAEE